MDYAEQQPLRAIYKPAGGWGAEEQEAEEVPPELKLVTEQRSKKQHPALIVAKWLVGAVLVLPLCVLAGVWFGFGGVCQCVMNMINEVRS